MKNFREDRRPADLWFWSDWFSSFDVRSCCLAAQGLWINILGIMSRAEVKGLLTVNGKQITSKDLAKIVGVPNDEVERLLVELEAHEVFSRLEDGTIYNRRMKKESDLGRKRAEAGRLGGLKQSSSRHDDDVVSKTEATLESDNDNECSSSSSFKEDNFLTWWAHYPRKIAKKVAAKAYAAAIKAGATPEELLRAAGGYAAEIQKNGTEEKFTKHPSTFLREERWRDYLNAPAKPVREGDNSDPRYREAYARRKAKEGV